MSQDNTNSSGSNNDQGPNKKRRRPNNRRRNNKNRNRKPSESNTVEASQTKRGTNPNRSNPNRSKKSGPKNSNKKKYNNRRRKSGPKLTGEDYIAAKYFNLLEQHLNARKKYFENFKRVEKHIEQKLERNFVESQKALLSFKERLNEKDRAIYEAKYENLSLDLTYSKNHNIAPTEHLEIKIDKDDIVDPHLLQTQISANFAEDTEESIGSLDDYKSYKGISE